MTTNSSTLGELIRRKRRSLRLNQASVGEMFDVDQSTIAKWERGDMPRPQKLQPIAEFLELPLNELMPYYLGDDLPAPSQSDALVQVQETLTHLAQQIAELTAAVRVLSKGKATKATKAVRSPAPPRAR